jgi:hypothetical protein
MVTERRDQREERHGEKERISFQVAENAISEVINCGL